jgi:predicted transcriptional regulator
MPKSLVQMASEVIAAQASHTPMSVEELSEGVRKVFEVLQGLHVVETSEIESKEIDSFSKDPQSSIQRNRVICLECGKDFKLLSNRHLALHNLTPRQYKQKHGIRMTQALSARTLSARRRKLAKELGMGKQLAAWRADRKRRAG